MSPTLTSTASKGQQTRDLIVARAYELALRSGLDGLTIAAVAEATQMSKSGVFAHFGSREDLQLAVLEHSARVFGVAVFQPILKHRRGLPRLRALLHGIVEFHRQLGAAGGCVMLSASSEYDDRPGPIRDAVVVCQQGMRRELVRAVQMAIDSGELKADTDAELLAFMLFGLMLAVQHDLRLFSEPRAAERAQRGVDELLAHCSVGTSESV